MTQQSSPQDLQFPYLRKQVAFTGPQFPDVSYSVGGNRCFKTLGMELCASAMYTPTLLNYGASLKDMSVGSVTLTPINGAGEKSKTCSVTLPLEPGVLEELGNALLQSAALARQIQREAAAAAASMPADAATQPV